MQFRHNLIHYNVFLYNHTFCRFTQLCIYKNVMYSSPQLTPFIWCCVCCICSCVRDYIHVYLSHNLVYQWNFELTLATFCVLGISVTTPDEPLNIHAMLLLSTLDLPARSINVNMKKYNGKYGCLYYESPDTSRESSHMHRDWPYEQHVTPRSHETVRHNASDRVASHQVVSLLPKYWL